MDNQGRPYKFATSGNRSALTLAGLVPSAGLSARLKQSIRYKRADDKDAALEKFQNHISRNSVYGMRY